MKSVLFEYHIKTNRWYVDVTKFWISCKWLKALRKASQWQLIKCSAPSPICWHQCDIRMPHLLSWVQYGLLFKNESNKQIASGYYHRDSFTKKSLNKVYTNHHTQKFPIYGTPLFANFSVFSLVASHNKDEWYSAKLWAKIGRQSCFRT